MKPERLNSAQRYLLSFGYPIRIVREYKEDSEFYREEVKDYAAKRSKDRDCRR